MVSGNSAPFERIFLLRLGKTKLVVPGFITKVVDIPAELKDECEDSAYEFKTEDDFKDIEDFTNALKQDKFEKES